MFWLYPLIAMSDGFYSWNITCFLIAELVPIESQREKIRIALQVVRNKCHHNISSVFNDSYS